MISNSLQETEKTAGDLASRVLTAPLKACATVIALSGDLGSGKTTFTKAFAAALGIPADTVTSPTFVIEKRFDLPNGGSFKKLIHIDAYRLEKQEEIERLDWRETIADPTNLVVIEWPENIGSALPRDAIQVAFRSIDENTREIVFN